MAVDEVIVRAGPVAVPLDYTVPTGTEIIPRSISANINGANAAGAFVPVLQIIAPSGAVTAYCARRIEIAAGASVLASWFPGVAEADDESQVGGITTVTAPDGTISVNNPTGPAVSVALPVTGVAAGSYGDGGHIPQITLDAEGRATAASTVPVSGGSGTIGFEIGYAQITVGVNITSLVEATGTLVINAGALTFDGSPVLVTFYAPAISPPTSGGSAFLALNLFEGATEIASLITVRAASPIVNLPLLTGFAQYRFTPTAGSHTYSITGFVTSTTGTPNVSAGPGGTGQNAPAFLRFTKV